MNPLYPLSSFVEKQKEEQQEVEEDPNLKLYSFSSASQVLASSSSSKLAFATCFSTSATQHDHQAVNLQLHHHLLQESHHQLQHDHDRAEKFTGGSTSCLVKSSMREARERSRLLDNHVEDQIKKQDDNGSAKYWMSSKMMINVDKKVTRNYNNNEGKSCCCNNNGVRVCSSCNTTTTPLWRSGPQGPKSLCNACGIRQRKARRAMAEAANGGTGAIVASQATAGNELHKEKKSRLSCHGDAGIVAHVKNKCNNNEITDHNSNLDSQSNGISVDRTHNFTLHLSKGSGSALGRVFPRDEEEAAILLMELSCGLLHSR